MKTGTSKATLTALIIFSSLYLAGCGKARFVQNRYDANASDVVVPANTIAPTPVTTQPHTPVGGPTQAPAAEYTVTTTDEGQHNVRILAGPAQCRSHEDRINLEATGNAIIELHNRSLEGDWMEDADVSRRGVLVMQFPLSTFAERQAIFPIEPAFTSVEDYQTAKRADRVERSFRARNQTLFIANGAQCTLTHILGHSPAQNNNWVYARVMAASSDLSPARVLLETPIEYYLDRRVDRNPQMFRLECEKLEARPFTIAEVNRITCSTVRMRVPNDNDFKITNAVCPRYGAVGRRSCANR